MTRRRIHSGIRSTDRATGVFGTSFGFLVFLIFLLFSVQLLFGLYARTTVTAVATDIAQRAANDGAGLDEAAVAGYETEARHRLGRYGEDVEVDLTVTDDDGDGHGDTVRVHIRGPLPTLLPTKWAPLLPHRFDRTMRAPLEVLEVAP